MKIKNDFVIKEIAGSYIVVPLGSQVVDFGGIVKLNETGAFLWNMLQEDKEKDELLSALLNEYDVNEEKASLDIDSFVSKLKDADLLE